MTTEQTDSENTTPWNAHWVEVEGQTHYIRRLRNGLADYRVITGQDTLRVLVHNDRQVDFDLMCDAQKHLSRKIITVPPLNVEAPCGLYVEKKNPSSLNHHRGRCKGCRAAEGRSTVIVYRQNPVETVLSAPSLAGHLSMKGLIEAMRLASSDALELAADYDAAIAAIENVPQLDEAMAMLQAKRSEHQQAITFFLKEA
jgi:hypothetical protein